MEDYYEKQILSDGKGIIMDRQWNGLQEGKVRGGKKFHEIKKNSIFT